MPMSKRFKRRVFPLVRRIWGDFSPKLFGRDICDLSAALSPAFHIYDELGIRETIALMKRLFFKEHPGTNFFAVKACPNIQILKIILDMGFGLDCASPTELIRAKMAGATAEKIMFTSNNTNPAFYPFVLEMGCILNLDDITFLENVSQIPKQICFRYNPGDRRTEGSNPIIGNPINQKYGLRHDQIVEAFRRARNMGAERFGLHTMYASNCRDPNILAGNARMQLQVVEEVQAELGIEFDFINIGGGLGINYKPEDPPLDIHLMAGLINEELDNFRTRVGYLPLLYIESGRYVTGPHGILVTKAMNVMQKYKKFIGIDACDAADILRAALYPAYHEISVLAPDGLEKCAPGDGGEIVSIVGPLCENMHMVSDRNLPKIMEGDFIVVHDTGAHGIAMKMNYNGWGCSQELLLKPDGSVVRISRAETIGDLLMREIDLTDH